MVLGALSHIFIVQAPHFLSLISCSNRPVETHTYFSSKLGLLSACVLCLDLHFITLRKTWPAWVCIRVSAFCYWIVGRIVGSTRRFHCECYS